MNKLRIESPIKESVRWETFIQPDRYEGPGIRVRKKIESACFEADFAIELAGVIRGAESMRKEQTAVKSTDRSRIFNSLFSGMTIEQTVEFVYCGRRGLHGDPYFRFSIRGFARRCRYCKQVMAKPGSGPWRHEK